MSRTDRLIGTGSRIMIATGWGREELEVTANGYGFSLKENENILKLDHGDGCRTL